MDNKEPLILIVNTREEFRLWLLEHHKKENECYLSLKRGKPKKDGNFYYLDAVEEALCFGWIDSTLDIINGNRLQRFTPRRKNSKWTELNKERVRRLEKLGLMTDSGRRVLPPIGVRSYKLDSEIENSLKKARAFSKFKSFPPLYQRVRSSNIVFYRKRDPKMSKNMLEHLIKETKKGKMFGEWNDYGRLLHY